MHAAGYNFRVCTGRPYRLYAALAGVDNPSDALLQLPPRHNLSNRRRPPNLPARSKVPEGHHPNNRLHLRLCAVGRAPFPPNPPSPLRGEAETPLVKRARSSSFGSSLPEEVGAAARPNDIMNNPTSSPQLPDCLPYLRSEGEGSLSAPAEARHQRKNQPHGTAERNTWKIQLKKDMATNREPLETFVFAGQSK